MKDVPELIRKALDRIEQHERQHGDTFENWTDIAALTTIKTGLPHNQLDCIDSQISVKEVRIKKDPLHEDSYVDVIGYTLNRWTVANRLAELRREELPVVKLATSSEPQGIEAGEPVGIASDVDSTIDWLNEQGRRVGSKLHGLRISRVHDNFTIEGPTPAIHYASNLLGRTLQFPEKT